VRRETKGVTDGKHGKQAENTQHKTGNRKNNTGNNENSTGNTRQNGKQ